jgi:flagellar basal-body rod protein FlgB
MTIIVDKALGVHQYGLAMRVERSRILAGNLANVDTPGYLARDYDFRSSLKRVANELQSRGGSSSMPQLSLSGELKYRVPMQPSQDGNTSELSLEQARFAANAMDFQTSLTFLNMKISGLKKAIEG